ncbi:Uncharacterized protein Fot_02223 [Forsythia ovata]|uniref:Uncharacterized protein n=1 Tax=Forsythia ovata TaxID=205694 RepID=A0ABD1X697_9LAMI
MNQDLSKLSPTVRASYEIFQGQILKEWEIESLFGNDMLISCTKSWGVFTSNQYLPTVHMKLFVLMTNDQFHGRKKNYKLKQFCHNNMEQGSSICQDGEEVEQSVPAQTKKAKPGIKTADKPWEDQHK